MIGKIKGKKVHLYDHISDMEPLLPKDRENILGNLSVEIYREIGGLGGALHPHTRKAVVELIRNMNSYYSNLIEGQHTRPRDIEAALKSNFSKDPKRKALQILHLAHLEVQKETEEKLSSNNAIDICSTEFILHIHQSFVDRLPEEFKMIPHHNGRKLVGGVLRDGDVKVGAHLAPDFKVVPKLLERFSTFYSEKFKNSLDAIIAVASSHHRLAFIHPFLDGNGRVTRLFTQAAMIKIGIDAGGLWAISRGLARTKDQYYERLSAADEKRHNDYDGRGYLTNQGLFEWCEYFLGVMLDQLKYMKELLSLETVLDRLMAFASVKEASKELPRGSKYILRDVFTYGEIARGDAGRIMGKTSRSARNVTHALLDRGLLQSPSEKGPLRIAFSAEAAEIYFPRLFPAGAED